MILGDLLNSVPLFDKLTLLEINEYFYIEDSKLKWKIRKANCVHIGADVGTTGAYQSVQLMGNCIRYIE